MVVFNGIIQNVVLRNDIEEIEIWVQSLKKTDRQWQNKTEQPNKHENPFFTKFIVILLKFEKPRFPLAICKWKKKTRSTVLLVFHNKSRNSVTAISSFKIQSRRNPKTLKPQFSSKFTSHVIQTNLWTFPGEGGGGGAIRCPDLGGISEDEITAEIKSQKWRKT